MSELIRAIRTAEDFDALLREPLAILDCYAPWCEPCKAFAAVLRRVAGEYPEGPVFAKLDVDRYEAIAKPLRVMSLPTLFIWKNGERVKRLSGALGARELRALIEGVRT